METRPALRPSSPARLRACALLLWAAVCGGPLGLGCPAADGRATPPAPPGTAPTPATAPQDARDPGGGPGPLARGTVVLETARGTWVVDVELARTPEARARGLMWRRDLPPDHGMLFLFDEDRVQSFWMHNTLIALDMIHLDQGRVVAGVVAHAEPHTDTPRTIGKPARYVLEVGAGEAAAHAVGPGVQARFLGFAE